MGRRLGQHFLTRKSILDRIARAACGEPCDGKTPVAIEIGPGKGALTASLLELASKVVAIEVDSYLVHYLRQKFAGEIESGRLELIEGDILKTDLAVFGSSVIAGNLPYYITSPILEKVFGLGHLWRRAAFLMQAEVAARLVASPGTRDYGYLSVQTQLGSRPEILFEVPREAFRPPPKVNSALVRLEPRDSAAELQISDKAGFLRFASACFRQKRKTLRNNLAPVFGRERMDALEEGRLRAEQLSIADLAALYRKLRG
ncbi:MAG TPA: 16S rRNA (adenine(1518)-N(6)/adenine(1519)-N(6))-dimethyltransferase RsmA [Bryobacteraceae bacterium]